MTTEPQRKFDAIARRVARRVFGAPISMRPDPAPLEEYAAPTTDDELRALWRAWYWVAVTERELDAATRAQLASARALYRQGIVPPVELGGESTPAPDVALLFDGGVG